MMRYASCGTIVCVRTTISLPEPLLQNAKRRAAERGVTLSTLIEDAVRRDLALTSSPLPPRFRLHTVRGRLVDPQVDLDRTSALIVRDDEAGFAGRRK